MIFNKKVEYGILFCLYLTRAGRATAKNISINLSIPNAFLDQIARDLRLNGVVRSTKGPGGGYELEQDVRIMDIVVALDPSMFSTGEFKAQYSQELRAFHSLNKNVNSTLNTLLNRRIDNLMQELVVNELGTLNRIDINGLEN